MTNRPSLALLGCVRDSNELLQRQIRYMNTLNTPHWFEVVYVDHYSNPPLDVRVEPKFKLKLIRSNDPRPWCMASLGNMAVKNTKADYFMFMGIDHMISQKFIDWFNVERIECHSNNPLQPGVRRIIPHFATGSRRYALLEEDGTLIPLEGNGVRRPHQFLSRKLFKAMDGFDQNLDIAGGEDLDIARRYVAFAQHPLHRMLAPIKYAKDKKWVIPEIPEIYMLPDKGDPRRPEHLLHELPPRGMCGDEFRKGIKVYDSQDR